MKDFIIVNISPDHNAESGANILGRSGEGYTTRLEITLPEELANYSAYLDFEKPNGETIRTPRLEVTGGVAVYDVSPYILTDHGELKVQFVLQGANGEIWKSSVKKYTIDKSINAVDDIPEKEDFISEAQKLIDALNQDIEEIARVVANDNDFVVAVKTEFEDVFEQSIAEFEQSVAQSVKELEQSAEEAQESLDQSIREIEQYKVELAQIVDDAQSSIEQSIADFEQSTSEAFNNISTNTQNIEKNAGEIEKLQELDKDLAQKLAEIAPYSLVYPNENGEFELKAGQTYRVFSNQKSDNNNNVYYNAGLVLSFNQTDGKLYKPTVCEWLCEYDERGCVDLYIKSIYYPSSYPAGITVTYQINGGEFVEKACSTSGDYTWVENGTDKLLLVNATKCLKANKEPYLKG